MPPRGWEIQTAMRLMLRNWKLAPGWGVSACRPSGWNHWLPPSQHEKEDSPGSTLLFCQLRIVMSVRLVHFHVSASEHLSLTWAQC